MARLIGVPSRRQQLLSAQPTRRKDDLSTGQSRMGIRNATMDSVRRSLDVALVLDAAVEKSR
jgi:hypothetical protein